VFIGLPILPTHVLFIQHESISCIVWEWQVVLGFLWTQNVSVEAEVNLRPTISRPVCLGVRRPSGTCDKFFFLLEISFRQSRVCYFVAPSLKRGRVCNLLYNCFWALPEQLLLFRSPTELTTIFYCLISDSPPTLRAKFPYLYPPGTPGHWVSFSAALCSNLCIYVVQWIGRIVALLCTTADTWSHEMVPCPLRACIQKASRCCKG
jgi:hypothetical protein